MCGGCNMIFLPNAFERYFSALRLYVQISVLRGGTSRKRLNQLKKISLAEAFYYRDSVCALDINEFCGSLLGAAVIIMLQKNVKTSVSFSGGGVFLLNRKIFTALLMELASNYAGENNKILVLSKAGTVSVVSEGFTVSATLERLVKAAGGFCLKENKKKRSVIVLPAKRTAEAPECVENEWCQILDRFSPVNIWFSKAAGEGFV